MIVYQCKVLEVEGHGEGDFTLGIFSTEEKAQKAFDKFLQTEDFPQEYCLAIYEYKLDEE
jgi:hypothetical protein